MQQAADQHPPWVPAAAMRYPVSPMVMHHPMVTPPPPPPPPPHFTPEHFFGFHQPMYPPPSPLLAAQQQYGTSAEENKAIWVGDLKNWMDENYLHKCFRHTGEVVSIKVIRNKQTGKSEGYGFVEFYTHAAADKVIQTFNGHIMPSSEQPFRLNWASFSTGDRRSDMASGYSIFVGDLAPDVTDSLLQETFANKYSSVKGAKVVIDANTGRSKGYGFVRFGNDNEKTLAMTEMNGIYCSSRPMRICAATPRKISGSNVASPQGSQSDGDSTNTTIFVGGLDPTVSEDELKQVFFKYGDIAYVKIPAGKQCGFVQFVQRNNANMALQELNGTVIGKQMVRLSWGRNPANKQPKLDPTMNQWSGGYYGWPFYNGYRYAVPFQHPGMYTPAYGPYSMYGFLQQVSY
ncbi:Polyadenylate-binding protein RBP47 [Apostasia shenzhenica]|uniref:Polyadenylate-binding protein RBP47 n=1 Tax=Apostasia shenzhenica TaxID=1088818 RepID=A0A2I0AKS6_9ASPA|nr:Polyadenylate-binding protein RBP47 [Apostasia shenzhenica]